MADEIPQRNDTDPAARVGQDLRARLRAMAQPELVELCAQLLATYVVEGVVPLSRAGEGTDLAADTGGEETFAQMIKRLKASKRDPVLERFLVDGENISVRIDGQGVMPLTQYRRPLTAPSAPGQQPAQPPPRRESVPGASTSIYNRSLYEQPPESPGGEAARPGKPAPAGAAPARGAPAAKPAPAAPGQPATPAGQQPKKDEPKNDRFSLIELE